jgi:hypothetical protein
MLLREKWPRAWIICHNFGVAIGESLIVNTGGGGRLRKPMQWWAILQWAQVLRSGTQAVLSLL